MYFHRHVNGESREAAVSLIWINCHGCEGLVKAINSEQDKEATYGVKSSTANWGPGPFWNRCESFHWLPQVWIKLTAGKHNLGSWMYRRNSEGRNSLSLTGTWPRALDVIPPGSHKKMDRDDCRRPRPQFLSDPVKSPFHQPHVSCTHSSYNNANTQQNRLLCKFNIITVYKKGNMEQSTLFNTH